MNKQEAIDSLECFRRNTAHILGDNDEKVKTIETCIMLVSEAEEAEKWIPVTKKAHPDLPIRVQVQIDNGWIITAYYQEGEWLSVPDCGEPLQDNWVEAWRELPEPYKEGKA